MFFCLSITNPDLKADLFIQVIKPCVIEKYGANDAVNVIKKTKGSQLMRALCVGSALHHTF